MENTKKEPTRLEAAVVKLYKAFHSGKLDAANCSMCAVGNICDNSSIWGSFFSHRVDMWGDHLLGIRPFETYGKFIFKENGYTGVELHNVERIFLEQFIGHKIDDKEAQFNGLCAVVEYLCWLDGVENVMDYTRLFETENDVPKYELEKFMV